MDAKEIRAHRVTDPDPGQLSYLRACYTMQREIAAQLAEANCLARLRLRWDMALSDTVRSEIRKEVVMK